MTKRKQSKPSFEVARDREVTTMNVRDFDGSNLIFNAERVGPVDHFQLRKSRFGPKGAGFKAPTFGEIVPLSCSAFENRDKKVIQILKNHWMTGKTLALTGREGLLVDDKPNLKLVRGNLGDYETSLKDRLGGRQEGNIFYSDNGLVRFIPYGFLQGEQSSSDFADNEGLIALVRNPGRAEMLGKAAEHYKLNPWLGGLSKTDSPQLRVPNVYFGGDVLDGYLLFVAGGDLCVHGGYSFGVRKGALGKNAEDKIFLP